MRSVANNLIFFDNPLAPMRLLSFGIGADYQHGIDCNMCEWSARGSSLIDTHAPMMKHLREHGIDVYIAGTEGPIN